MLDAVGADHNALVVTPWIASFSRYTLLDARFVLRLTPDRQLN
jgi:hypothetical protein